jgi:deoxycytidylate deaminase
MVIPDSSKKTRRYFEIARKCACNSTYGSIRHGAVLIKSGRIISISFNKENFSSFGSRFRKPESGNATVHAEIGAILGVSRKHTSGANMYVVRVGKKGNFQMSKPCDMCQQALRFVGVKKVFYTSRSGEFEMLKLNRRN